MLAFLGTCGVLVFLFRRGRGDAGRGIARLRELKAPEQPGGERPAGDLLWALVWKAGALLLPNKGQRRARLQARLNQAGLYAPGTLHNFLGVQLLLTTAVPVVVALALFLSGKLSPAKSLLAGLASAGVGLVAPGLWLDGRKKRYQGALRRALPDALDLMVLCLEGGASLTAALQRVTEDLDAAHPLLVAEMGIIQREMRMGLSAGESFKKFGERCDLEDVRDLAATLLQSERFGSGVAKALRIHADAGRQDRQQRAEEAAQKAAVKILFPTLLCIFPAIFIVLLGPAAFQMASLFSKGR
jgi:tight adherence protein C